MRTLYIPVKRKWFDQIKAKTKLDEYRLLSQHWKSRLINQQYDRLIITLGYPPKTDLSRRLEFNWDDWRFDRIQSEEFGEGMHNVFAISLRKPLF